MGAVFREGRSGCIARNHSTTQRPTDTTGPTTTTNTDDDDDDEHTDVDDDDSMYRYRLYRDMIGSAYMCTHLYVHVCVFVCTYV